MKMNICFTGYAHPFGEVSYYGAERIIWYLMQELMKLGHKCTLFSVKGCNVPGVEFIEMPKPWDDTKDLYYEAIEAKESENGVPFDMIHSFMASGCIDSRIRKKSYCLYPFMGFRPFQENLIAYSKRMNQVHGNKGTLIYPGIPDFGLPVEDPGDYLVWIGRIDPGKVPEIAIDTAKRAGCRIVLMGPSYHYPHFHDHIWKRIDGDRVIWLRAVDDEIKYKVLRKAKGLLQTNWSGYHEMFGITMTEALSCGVPVIGWGHKTQPSAINFEGGEIIAHGEHGFINEYSDYSEAEREASIERAVGYVNDLDNIDRVKCNQLFKDRFTAREMAEKHMKYYRIIKERGSVYDVTNELC